jgi:tetratricopeptide (TPR) repeat protein
LDNLGVQLSVLGRRKDAVAAAEEAVTIYRRLAEANPAAYLSGLASALNNLGVLLSELGRLDEALAAAEEAVDIGRQLAEANPAAHLPDLAAALANLGNRLAELGRRKEALAPTNEATTHYRRLAEAHPAAYLPNLAMALYNLGIRLRELGRLASQVEERLRELDKALAAIEEVVDIRRRLAEAQPAAHLPNLAAALKDLGLLLVDLGRPEQALAPIAEAFDIDRSWPRPTLPPTCITWPKLRGFASVQDGVATEAPAALIATDEAVAILEALCQSNAALFADDLEGARATRAAIASQLNE